MSSLNPGEMLDWSTPGRQVHVYSNLVLGFLTLDFDGICQRLVGKMKIHEIAAAVFEF